ncbi:MAG: hypothetical protein HW387_4 [Parachlamydiales bacterium]|nr:hypothetical protein [Parachlamydiales bacterium]
MNIILIGFMGSGKSAVAQCLSQMLGYSLVEMDDLVYQKTNTRNMPEVFEKGGERLLRETEIAIAKEVATRKAMVVSTGGGVVLNKIILDYLKNSFLKEGDSSTASANGKVIFLNAGFEQIAKRLEGDDSRPLFQNREMAKKIYDFRLPLYINYADEMIDVDFLSVEKIALQIKDTHGL